MEEKKTVKEQEEEIAKMNIYQKLSAITNSIDRIKKDLNVSTGGNGSYKAVGEGNVLLNIKPYEEKYHVYSYPVFRNLINQDYLVNEGKATKLLLRVETTYRFVNMDNPSEFVDMISYGDGIDTGDKAPGKAVTYSDKYALLKAYKIETGDDPDKSGSDNDTYKGKKQYDKSQYTSQPKAPAKPTEQLPMSRELLATYYRSGDNEIISTITDLMKGRKIEVLSPEENKNLYETLRQLTFKKSLEREGIK